MLMPTVPIDPAVALGEANAMVEFLRNRNLLLAQAVAELKAQLVAAKALPMTGTAEESTS